MPAKRRPTGRFRKSSRDLPVPVRYIAGNAEVRTHCGSVTRHTLIRWRRDNAFPEPIARLECGEIWDLREVTEWHTAWTAAHAA